MKYFVIFVLVGFTIFFNTAHAELDKAISEPFEISDVVLIGTVVQTTITPENKTQYDFKVEEYLKGKKPLDLITATLDSIRSADFPKDPLDYFNRPYFEKENQVFVYLKQDGSTFQMSPHSFTVKKPTVVGPPNLIHATGPQQHIIPQGEEIVISGTIKKAYLYTLERSGFDSRFDLVILNENEELVATKKLDINLDGSYSFTFQNKGELRIPGKYSWEIAYHNGSMGGEFIVKTDQKRWTPLKQFNVDIMFHEIQCKENLVLIQKYDGSPACVTESTRLKLIERGWTTKDSSIEESLLESYNNLPEVKAFYETYEDVKVSVRNDHVSYYSGSDEGYFVRMNLMFDEDHFIKDIDFHCYYQRVPQYDLPQEDTASKIVKYDCKEHGNTVNTDSEHANKDSSELTKCVGDALCLTEKITRIIDGDTIYLGDYKIRLSLTNTPERHEIGFNDASKFTAKICPVGSVALVDQDDLQPYDVYDRILGKVVCTNKVLNSELLYAGHANILEQYCSTSEFSEESWAQEFGC